MSAKWNSAKPGTKTWVHSAAALTAGHVVYNIKYLGHVEVSAPKGADIVKEAVTKLKFNKQVKRSEGTKPPKKELTISVDGVTIQDRQTKEKEFSYPLHHISYCADDKSDKKICAFIAKDLKENRHLCHVMESDKNAEEITLTVGQAFDLAYQKFLASANKSQEQQQQNDTLRKRVEDLEAENKKLKQRINEFEAKQGLPPSFMLPTNGEQIQEKPPRSSVTSNPFSPLPEPNISNQFYEPATPSAPSLEPITAINFLAELQLGHTETEPQFASQEQISQQEEAMRKTLAEQAAAYQAAQQPPAPLGDAFADIFNPSPSPAATATSAAASKNLEALLPPPPPALPRQKEAPAPFVLPSAPMPETAQAPLPASPLFNGPQTPQSPIDPGIARSRPRPNAVPQGQTGVLAPPPRSLRRGDSMGPQSPSAVPGKGAGGGLGLDDLYAAVSKVSNMNGNGAAASTTSPNPFNAPTSTQFGFGDNNAVDLFGNKGSSNISATTSTNAFSVLDLDPLK